MLIDYNKTWKQLEDIRTGKTKESLKIDVPEIDDYFRFKEGNLNVILGHSNVGKTTVALYFMLLYTKKLKVKWLVFSSENTANSIVRKLVEYLEQKPITKISKEAFDNHLQYVHDNFKIIDSESLYTYRSLIELATSIKKVWDYKGFLLDPYNSLAKDPDIFKSIGGHEYDYQAATEFRIFCKKHNITMWLNTHANTSALRIKHPIGHEYAGHPIPPLASDVEGGGKWVNRCDDFLVCHRYSMHSQDWMYSHIHIRKVKEIETGGRPTPIDEPIKLKSMIGNVGFEINGSPILKTPLQEPPF